MGDRHALMDLDKERAERCFGDRPRYVLPNGLEIVHLNQYETDYVYKEIFEDQCYLRHGIRLRDGDYGRGYRRQYRALFFVCDEPL